MLQQQEKGHWLDKYATDYATWKLQGTPDGKQSFQRPMGLVETSFDIDGRYFGGRAGTYARLSYTIQFAILQSTQGTLRVFIKSSLLIVLQI